MSIDRPARNIKSITLLLLTAFAFLMGVRSGTAATSYWIEMSGGGFFTDGNEWNPVGVPGAADTAAFTNNPGVYQGINWSFNTTTANGLFSSPDSNIRDLNIGSRTWFVTNSVAIGPNPGDLDNVRLLSGNLVVTNAAGTGTFEIGNGLYTQFGNLTVDRFVSTNSSFGNAGLIIDAGTLNVLNGATITSASHLQNAGATWNFLGGNTVMTENPVGGVFRISDGGKLTVDGPSTTLTNNVGESFYVGWDGMNNQLTVTNGARFHNTGGLKVGADAVDVRNKITVTGTNSLLSNAGGIFVGFGSSSNEMTVADGATVDAAYVMVGYLGTALDNRLVVTGPNTILRGGLFVGNSGDSSGGGTVLISNGATVEPYAMKSGAGNSGSISNIGGVYQFTSPTPTIVANSANSIMVQNGTISFKGINNAPVNQAGTQLTNITYQGNNAYRLVSATNTAVASYTFQTNNAPGYASLVLDNGRFQATTMTIGQGASLSGNGTVASTSVTNLGTIAPGFSPGQVTFTGDLVLGESSRLEMQIGGTASVDYDQLIVGGNVTVTGTLAIAMINAFSPTPGDTFTLIDNQGVNPISGLFNGLTNNAFIDASGNGIDAFFTIHYDGGTGNDLVLFATIPEPSTTLLLFGVGVFILRGRRR